VAEAVVRVRLHTTVYDIKKPKELLRLLSVLSESVKGLFQQWTPKHRKSAQLNKVLCQWSITMHSKGKPMTGSAIIQTATSFYGAMKIMDRRTFCEGWLSNLYTIWQSGMFNYPATVQPHGCWVKEILLY